MSEKYNLEEDMQRLEYIKNQIQSGNVKVNDMVELTVESIELEKNIKKELEKVRELIEARKPSQNQ